MPTIHRLWRLLSGSPLSVAVGALALASALLAVLVSQVVFPELSINNDEPIYRLQADALAHGHLFLPTGESADAFRPWLAAVRDGHYVLKYPPFFPALVAISQVLTGGPALLFASLAAAAVAMTYLLALEILRDRRQALVAASLVALSPLSILLGSLVLPYMTAFVLLEAAAWGILRGLSTGSRKPLIVAGAAFGLVFAMRPYDALLFVAPLAVLLLWRSRRSIGRLRAAVAFGAPSLAGGIAFLAANAVMTGSPLRPPFALLESRDSLGFGVRRLYPTDVDHDFGPMEGIEGVYRHAMLLNRWVAGGTILLVLAVVTLVRTRRGDPLRWVALAGAMLPAGYLVFWGPWNATVLWGGTRWVGPFYFLPVLIPVALLGARGLAQAYEWRRWAGGGLAAAMVVFTVAAITPVVRGNLTYTRQSRDLVALLARPDARDKLVLVDAVDPYLMHPSAVVANRWDLSGPVLHALSRGDDDIDVAARFPDRTPYRLNLIAGSVDPDDPFSARLERLLLVRAPVVQLTFTLPVPGDLRPGLLRVLAGGTAREYRMTPDDRARPWALAMKSGGAEITGRVPDREYPQPGGEAGLRVEVIADRGGAGDGPSPVPGVETFEMPARTVGGIVEALVPTGAAWTAGDPWPGVVTVSASG